MPTVFNKESIKFDSIITLETIICYKCAVPFAIPERLKRHLHDSQEIFYCPNGHSQCYTKSTETILRERLEAQRASHERQIKNMQDRIDDGVKQRTVLKGKLTKVKNRIKNGVCPCCNRTFQNLHQHMKSQHPDYAEQNN